MTRHNRRRYGRRRVRPPALLLCLLVALPLFLLLRARTPADPEPVVPLPRGAELRAEMAQLSTDFIAALNRAVARTPHDALDITHSADDGILITNWSDMIAISAVGGEALPQVFAKMVTISTETAWTDPSGALLFPAADGTLIRTSMPAQSAMPAQSTAPKILLRVSVLCRTAQDAARDAGFTRAQQAAVVRLLADTDDKQWADLLGGVPADSAETAAVRAALPEHLAPQRRKFVMAACDLVGRVDYFWGGKSAQLGWDSRWGVPALVTAPGISDAGTVMPYGMDCSGFISWAAVTAAGTRDAYAAVGDGVRQQFANATPIPLAEAQPGDLLFFPDLSHIGIVAGRNENGGLRVLHCAHSKGGVVLGEDAQTIGFTSAGQPGFYGLFGLQRRQNTHIRRQKDYTRPGVVLFHARFQQNETGTIDYKFYLR